MSDKGKRIEKAEQAVNVKERVIFWQDTSGLFHATSDRIDPKPITEAEAIERAEINNLDILLVTYVKDWKNER